MTNDVGHLFLCLLAIPVSYFIFFGEVSIQIFRPFLSWASGYIFGMQPIGFVDCLEVRCERKKGINPACLQGF